jgi:hypothetical protein
MHSFSKVLGYFGLVFGVLFVGVAVGWLATRKTVPDRQPIAPTTVPSKPAWTNAGFFPANARPRHSQSPSNNLVPPPPGTGTNLISDWEKKLDDILGSEGDETSKAKQMLAIFRRLPTEGQVEVAQHVSNLLPDEEYAPLGKLLTDSKLPEEVLDVLVVDVLNRPNSVKLPLLLEVARDPTHPKAVEAKELLEVYLEADYGNDWSKWQAKLDQWMKDNPD